MKQAKATRVWAVLMALLTSLSVTACGNGGDSGSSEGSATSSTSSSSSSSGESSGQKTQEVRKISCVGMTYTNPSRPWWSPENYHDWETGKAFDQKLADMNIELEMELIAYEQYEDTMKSRLASNLDLPDIIRGAGSQSDWIGYGKNGMTWNINELLETYDADGSIMDYLRENCPTSLGTILEGDGNLWWFPHAYQYVCDGGSGSAFMMSLRADWMENLGMEFKNFYTPDELYDILVAFRENDANGNGVADEVLGFDPASQWEPISAGFGIGQKYIYALNDGSGVQCKLDHENFPAFIEYCQKLYQAGVLSTEILNSDNGIVSGNRASAVYDYNAQGWLEASIAGYEDTAEYAGIVIDDDAGVNGYMLPCSDNADMAILGWLINKECKEPQAVVDLMDYIYSDQGNMDLYWGIEGVTFEYKDGLPEFIVPSLELYGEDSTISPLWQVVTVNCLPGVCVVDSRGHVDAMRREQEKEGMDYKNMAIDIILDAAARDIPRVEQIQPFAIATDAEQEVLNAKYNDVCTYINELILDLILGNKSLADLDTYRAELTTLGLDDVIEVYRARYDRYMASQK